MKKLSFVSGVLFVLTALAFVLISPPKTNAQLNSIGFSNYLPINNSKVEDGDIIIASDKGYTLSTVPYDPKIIGVVTLNPAISFKEAGNKKGVPVISSGTAFVKVSGLNGDITKGDFITSSTTPGTGMKAVDNGYVVGIAIENVKFSKKTEIKEIEVSINPHFTQFSVSSSFLDIFNLKKVASYEKPSKLIQYIVAAFIMVASFACGFLIFAKAVNTGLEALGRNPLAGRMIQLGIVFNVVLIIVIIVAGTALAYLVIRL